MLLVIVSFALTMTSCGQSGKTDSQDSSTDTVTSTVDSIVEVNVESDSAVTNNDDNGSANVKVELPVVLVYNFHLTNRCASCIAIEEATTKTLNTYFAAELKQGRIKRQILNVDDEVNEAIAEKYQAYGASIFVTRVYKGKETTKDLTGDGFKYAKNKEEKFIEILKNTLTEFLK